MFGTPKFTMVERMTFQYHIRRCNKGSAPIFLSIKPALYRQKSFTKRVVTMIWISTLGHNSEWIQTMDNSLQTGKIVVEIGAGELIDKITILTIKSERINDPIKLTNISREIDALTPARGQLVKHYPAVQGLEDALKSVNEALWDIEDDIRACEASQDFGTRFIELARSVYFQNDKRAEIKKKINILCEASIIEEKSYKPYQ